MSFGMDPRGLHKGYLSGILGKPYDLRGTTREPGYQEISEDRLFC